MSKLINTLILAGATTLASSPLFALPDMDDEDVRDTVDISSFEVGSDGDVGTLFYIVDRTSNNCFASIKVGSQASGITAIKCESLNAIPAIEKYLEIGAGEE